MVPSLDMRQLTAAVLLLACCFRLNGQDTKFRIRVHVDVNISDVDVRNRISSNLNADLRKLGDIEIVDSNPRYVIKVVVVAAIVNNVTIGYSIATLVEEPVRLEFLKTEVKTLSKVDSKSLDAYLDYVLSNSVKVRSMSIENGGRDLSRICESIVSAIDADVFEPDRRTNQKFTEINELLKNTSPK